MTAVLRRVSRVIGVLLALAMVLFVGLCVRELYSTAIDPDDTALSVNDAMIERGEYLATIGNCAGCHTARGGESMAGGRRIQTPFGAVVATNITPDKTHGIGAWSAADFYRALHEGRSKNGRVLSPAFPYTNTTLVSRSDSDAMYAFFMNRIAPSSRANEGDSMGFPYNSQFALAAWRVLFFNPAPFERDASQSDSWHRGAYLANGLAHCTACHGARNALGAPIAGREYAGAMMPLNDWYAPSLTDRNEASVADWSIDEIALLLQVGHTPRASALGPMADVVFKSTQHLHNDDARAMATYLQSLPVSAAAPVASAKAATLDIKGRGAKLYETHCQTCHGERGEGKLGIYPALAKNRAVTMPNASNLIRITQEGGFAPSTPGNPAPYGMPPFYHVLKDDEIADVLTYIRTAWGNDGAPITALYLANYRNSQRTSK